MKKNIQILHDCLCNFWFSLLLINIALFLVFFTNYSEAILVFNRDFNFGGVAVFLERLLFIFLIPLLALSVLISSYLRFKGDDEKYKALFGLIISVTAFASVLIMVSKISILQTDIDSGNSIFDAPSVGMPEGLPSFK